MLDVPESPKVYTTVYDNFKGVDFTNDATNVWKRRSPTGKNMLPDSSGRPFKRHGWEILLSNDDLCAALQLYEYAEAAITEEEFSEDPYLYFTESGGVYTQCDDESVYDENETYYIRTYPKRCKINKCAYFELKGVDHIVVFTDAGVIFYNEQNGVTAINKDNECYLNYERNFFFEGAGTSAFYIYGNFRMWRYNKDFILEEVTDQLTIPTVLIGTSADCVGTTHYGYNLLGNKIAVEYNDDTIFTYFTTGDFAISVSENFKTHCPISANYNYYAWEATVSGGSVTWAWSGVGTAIAWSTVSADFQFISDNIKTGDQVIVIHSYGVVLPNNVAQGQADEMEAYVSTNVQFDTPLEVKTSDQAINNSSCRLMTNPSQDGRAWLIFNKDYYDNKWQGEDYIRVVLPSVQLVITEYSSDNSNILELSGTASLVGGATP